MYALFSNEGKSLWQPFLCSLIFLYIIYKFCLDLRYDQTSKYTVPPFLQHELEREGKVDEFFSESWQFIFGLLELWCACCHDPSSIKDQLLPVFMLRQNKCNLTNLLINVLKFIWRNLPDLFVNILWRIFYFYDFVL